MKSGPIGWALCRDRAHENRQRCFLIMGYYPTNSTLAGGPSSLFELRRASKRTPPFQPVRPKTHTPFSPVQDRGYRFYNPQTGRWASRDPKEEGGGILLYMFCANNPGGYIDPLGLSWILKANQNDEYAIAIADGSSSLTDLATMMALDVGQVMKWARKNVNGMKFVSASELKSACELYVPNRILIFKPALGAKPPWYNLFSQLKQLSMGGLRNKLSDAEKIYKNHNFNVKVLDWESGGIGSPDTYVKWPTYGIVMGGHGIGGVPLMYVNLYLNKVKKQGITLRGGGIDFGGGTSYYPDDFENKEYRFGTVIVFGCFASDAAWQILASMNAETFISPSKFVSLLGFPSISPKRSQ